MPRKKRHFLKQKRWRLKVSKLFLRQGSHRWYYDMVMGCHITSGQQIWNIYQRYKLLLLLSFSKNALVTWWMEVLGSKILKVTIVRMELEGAKMGEKKGGKRKIAPFHYAPLCQSRITTTPIIPYQIISHVKPSLQNGDLPRWVHPCWPFNDFQCHWS